MTLLIDLIVVLLLAGAVVLGVVLRLRRMIAIGMLGMPWVVVIAVTFGHIESGFVPGRGLLLGAFAASLSLLLLVRLPSGWNPRAQVILNVLLRLPAVVALGLVPLARVLLARSGGAGDGWPYGFLAASWIVALNVAIQLLASVVEKWRSQEPRWFRSVPGQALSGLFGPWYVALLLFAIVRVSCTAPMTLPACRLPFLAADETPDVLEFQTPLSYQVALAGTRLAYHFLDPADPWQSQLLRTRTPNFGIRIQTGYLPTATGPDTPPGVKPPVALHAKWPVPALIGRLLTGRPDCLALCDSTGFDVLQFRDTTWVSVGRVPFVNPYARFECGRASWCTGDVDDDGLDEIVAGDSNRLAVFKWQDSSFKRREYDFRYEIDNLAVGDINNDGHNEIILSGSDEKLVDGPERERICVVRLTDDGPEMLWNDRGGLGIGDSRVGPADALVAVADVENERANELLVCRSGAGTWQWPSVYLLLKWQDNALRISRDFSIVGGSLVAPQRVAELAAQGNMGAFAYGPLVPGRFGGRCVSLVRILLNMQSDGVNVLVLDPNRVRTLGRLVPFDERDSRFSNVLGPTTGIPRFHDPDLVSQPCWLDPDGKGTAILRVSPSARGSFAYELDRMRPISSVAARPATSRSR